MPTNLIVELHPLIQTMTGYRGCPAPVTYSCPGVHLKNRSQLNAFFSTEEKNAFRVVRYSIGNDEDALDIIQDAMIKFISKYSDKTREDWKPLFYKIVQSKLIDFHRKKNFRSGIMRLLGSNPEEGYNEIDAIASPDADPVEKIKLSDALVKLDKALEALPARQQQVVLMRSWQGFNTQETAKIMQLSTGSVKTHYSRGLAKLKELLGDDWP